MQGSNGPNHFFQRSEKTLCPLKGLLDRWEFAMEDNNQTRISVTWYYVLRIWWSFTWQSLFFGTLIGLVLWQISIFTRHFFDLGDVYQNIVQAVSALSIFIMQIFVFKLVLTQKYRKFRIAIISSERDRV